jgi:RNA polymerase sigma-70 factor, ECF subfamily
LSAGWSSRDAAPAVGIASAAERERELLRRVAERDRAAFAELYTLYHRRLARFLRRFTHRFDVAEEIINDTMWVVWRKTPEFRGASLVSTWILGIAYRRALKTLQRVTLVTEPLNFNDRDTAHTAEDAQQTEELREWLQLALVQLPIEQRMVLELTYYLGHSCEEVAAIMDCPVNTVKTRMFHARAKLKNLLPQLAGAGAEVKR